MPQTDLADRTSSFTLSSHLVSRRRMLDSTRISQMESNNDDDDNVITAASPGTSSAPALIHAEQGSNVHKRGTFSVFFHFLIDMCTEVFTTN